MTGGSGGLTTIVAFLRSIGQEVDAHQKGANAAKWLCDLKSYIQTAKTEAMNDIEKDQQTESGRGYRGKSKARKSRGSKKSKGAGSKSKKKRKARSRSSSKKCDRESSASGIKELICETTAVW